jgi:hypothetical protein
MATIHSIALFDWVELLEPVDNAPVGARGGVLEFLKDDHVMLEIMEPDLEEILDRIVVVPLSKVRVVKRHSGS